MPSIHASDYGNESDDEEKCTLKNIAWCIFIVGLAILLSGVLTYY